MERLKEILRRVFAPGVVTVLLCTAAAAVLLAETFLRDLQDAPLAGVIYAFSAYALVLALAAGMILRAKRRLRAAETEGI